MDNTDDLTEVQRRLQQWLERMEQLYGKPDKVPSIEEIEQRVEELCRRIDSNFSPPSTTVLTSPPLIAEVVTMPNSNTVVTTDEIDASPDIEAQLPILINIASGTQSVSKNFEEVDDLTENPSSIPLTVLEGLHSDIDVVPQQPLTPFFPSHHDTVDSFSRTGSMAIPTIVDLHGDSAICSLISSDTMVTNGSSLGELVIPPITSFALTPVVLSSVLPPIVITALYSANIVAAKDLQFFLDESTGLPLFIVFETPYAFPTMMPHVANGDAVSKYSHNGPLNLISVMSDLQIRLIFDPGPPIHTLSSSIFLTSDITDLESTIKHFPSNSFSLELRTRCLFDCCKHTYDPFPGFQPMFPLFLLVFDSASAKSDCILTCVNHPYHLFTVFTAATDLVTIALHLDSMSSFHCLQYQIGFEGFWVSVLSVPKFETLVHWATHGCSTYALFAEGKHLSFVFCYLAFKCGLDTCLSFNAQSVIGITYIDGRHTLIGFYSVRDDFIVLMNKAIDPLLMQTIATRLILFAAIFSAHVALELVKHIHMTSAIFVAPISHLQVHCNGSAVITKMPFAHTYWSGPVALVAFSWVTVMNNFSNTIAYGVHLAAFTKFSLCANVDFNEVNHAGWISWTSHAVFCILTSHGGMEMVSLSLAITQAWGFMANPLQYQIFDLEDKVNFKGEVM